MVSFLSGNSGIEVIILRVDDRLVHGQVIAGWVRPLGIDTIILASDALANDEWACTAYRLAVPEGIRFQCCGIDRAAALVRDGIEHARIMIVVERMSDAYELIVRGVPAKEVIIGGLSHTDGSRAIAPYINLSPQAIEAAIKIYQLGVRLTGRQLPNSPPIDVAKRLIGL